MSKFYGIYITTDKTEFLLDVGGSVNECKRVFSKWYTSVNYTSLSVEYKPVDVTEVKDERSSI